MTKPDKHGWLPIESAPKMRTVLLFAVTERRNNGAVNNWKMGSGFWSKGHDAWIWEGHALKIYDHKPTHWQPLPAPPEDER